MRQQLAARVRERSERAAQVPDGALQCGRGRGCGRGCGCGWARQRGECAAAGAVTQARQRGHGEFAAAGAGRRGRSRNRHQSRRAAVVRAVGAPSSCAPPPPPTIPPAPPLTIAARTSSPMMASLASPARHSCSHAAASPRLTSSRIVSLWRARAGGCGVGAWAGARLAERARARLTRAGLWGGACSALWRCVRITRPTRRPSRDGGDSDTRPGAPSHMRAGPRRARGAPTGVPSRGAGQCGAGGRPGCPHAALHAPAAAGYTTRHLLSAPPALTPPAARRWPAPPRAWLSRRRRPGAPRRRLRAPSRRAPPRAQPARGPPGASPPPAAAPHAHSCT